MRAQLLVVACLVSVGCNCGGRIEPVTVSVDVNPRTLDFGLQAPGQLARQQVTFTAHGAVVRVDRITLRDDVRGSFSVGIGPATLSPEEPISVEVIYSPRTEGADSALLVATLSEGLDELMVPIVGRAQLAAALDSGVPDAGEPDSGTPDAGEPDAGEPDAGAPDAGEPDAGAPDAGAPDAGAPDAGESDAGEPDAGEPDAGPPDAGPPDAGLPDAGDPDAGVYGPPLCPIAALSRDVATGTSVLPNLTWVGSGYVIAVDEVVGSAQEITLQRTDARGTVVAGPVTLTPPAAQPLWPSVSFSGVQFGVTYLDDRSPTRRAYFARADASLQLIPGSELALGASSSAAGSARVAWNPTLGEWGVAWSQGNQVHFERLSAAGVSLGAVVLSAGTLSENGNPLVATPTGWAVVASGSPARVIEVGAGAPVSTLLPIAANRASIAFGAGQLAVVGDGILGLRFVRVQGGAVVPNSTLTLGTSYGNLPSVGFDGQSFLAVWSETVSTSPAPLKFARISPSATTATVLGTALTTKTNAGFQSLSVGSCGFGLVYGVFAAVPHTLEVHP